MEPADIPPKRYFQINEVAELTGCTDSTLRHWENVFPMLKVRRRNNRRYYTRENIILIRRIAKLVRDDQMKIEGAIKALRSPGQTQATDLSAEVSAILVELEDARKQLKSIP